MFELTELFDYAEKRDFGEIHIKADPKTGLRAIIAIHSTTLGPALGGCRCIEYTSVSEAFHDALRLARAMSYKAAVANLPLGGGKTVLVKPEYISDRKAYFRKYGQFVNALHGEYITAEDSGTTVEDMITVATQTPYVAGASLEDHPSPHTAHGVLRGIQAAVKYKLQRDSLEDIHVAIQGVGSVGYYLAKELQALGARLTIADISDDAINRCLAECDAQVVNSVDIHRIACDVFTPCALGAVINDRSAHEIQAPIVAGSANNQLAHAHHARLLFERSILYAPDYIINAGGLIYVAKRYFGENGQVAHEQIDHLYDVLLEIFTRSTKEELPTSTIVDMIAEEKLGITKGE